MQVFLITWYYHLTYHVIFFYLCWVSLDQLISFIILLSWLFYNSKSSIPNRSASLFGKRRSTHLPKAIKSSIKKALKRSRPCCSPCWNLFPSSISPSLGPALFCNLTPGPTLISAPVIVLASTLVTTNKLFKQFMKAYLESNHGARQPPTERE